MDIKYGRLFNEYLLWGCNILRRMTWSTAFDLLWPENNKHHAICCSYWFLFLFLVKKFCQSNIMFFLNFKLIILWNYYCFLFYFKGNLICKIKPLLNNWKSCLTYLHMNIKACCTGYLCTALRERLPKCMCIKYRPRLAYAVHTA